MLTLFVPTTHNMFFFLSFHKTKNKKTVRRVVYQLISQSDQNHYTSRTISISISLDSLDKTNGRDIAHLSPLERTIILHMYEKI